MPAAPGGRPASVVMMRGFALRGGAVGQDLTGRRGSARRPVASAPPSSSTLATVFFGVLGERLLEQDVLLEVAVDATLDDLREGGLGLALLLGRGLGDATLVLDRLGRDVGPVEDGRARTRRRACDVATDGGVAALERDEDADLRGQVGARLVEVGETVAPSRRPPAGPRSSRRWSRWPRRALLHGAAASSVLASSASASPALDATACARTSSASATNFSPFATKSVSQRTSTRVPTPSPAWAATRPLEVVRPSRLRDALEALDPQDLDGLGAVAVGLVERLLDVHHAGAGLLAKRLDVSGGVVRHALFRSLRS